MKKIIALMVLASFIMLGTYSCKKYEEGPMISLRTKTKRLEGTWKIDKATQDGIDVTSQLPTVIWTFEKDGKFNSNNNSTDLPGTWEFDSKKENILIKFDGSTDTEKFEIIRLKDKELWLDQDVGGQILRIEWIPS